ncbi:hypothetical protein R1sor_012771 [Riccia sorocarpa]|uniref:Uncharacterized protein n=1 Tax=Riccia sorocarpa TaxID=122646 RepID=A0ABD3I8B0_9MARC
MRLITTRTGSQAARWETSADEAAGATTTAQTLANVMGKIKVSNWKWSNEQLSEPANLIQDLRTVQSPLSGILMSFTSSHQWKSAAAELKASGWEHRRKKPDPSPTIAMNSAEEEAEEDF